MNIYLDTSAVIPVLIAESSSEICRRLWENADRRLSSMLSYVEVAAALAMAERQRRISAAEHDEAWANFNDIWPDVHVVELTGELAASAASLARSLELRGYDAVHCASAVAVNDSELVAAAGDNRLLAAWQRLCVAVVDTKQTD